jgi:hypothetical protein
MRRTKVVCVALAGFASVAGSVAGSASATPAEVRTVILHVSPENAAVAVDGHPRQHRNGVLELRGPLGAVFNVEAVASGSNIVQRVAVTDVGALPSRLVVPVAAGVPGAAPPVVAPDECSPAFWRDADDIKHYKPQCLALESYDDGTIVGALTVVCMPKCDRIVLDGRHIGPGHIFDRAVIPGRHMLELSAPNGSRRTVYVDVSADQTKELRVAMNGEAAVTVGGDRPDDAGFLTLASYPWSNVSEGGRPLCVTPCVKLPLGSGVHVLVLENEAAGLKQTISVTIRGGETTTKHVLSAPGGFR